MTGPDFRLDIRCRTAAGLLGEAAAGSSKGVRTGTEPRVFAGGRFAALHDLRILDDGPTPTNPPAAAHPSWTAAALSTLPAPVARRWLDRLGPLHARAALAALDGETAARLRSAVPAPPDDLVEGLLGRRTPPAFPPAPSWAVPPAAPECVARALAREPDWPARPDRWGEAEGRAAAAARRSVAPGTAAAEEGGWPDDETARGLARLAFALFDRPDEAWGLAGAWPRRAGIALLAAWNAWPDLGALGPDAAPVRARAAERLRRRWSSWAG